MIQITDLRKNFGDICAVNDISLDIPDGSMFGLLGTNGAGKTTLLKMLAGILWPDAGKIQIDGKTGCLEPDVKENVFYLPDDPYYFPNTGLGGMADFYKRQYPLMETEAVSYMAEKLGLDMLRPLRTFSKGMKRQAFLILALCAGTKYLLCDEVFDGLDPMVTEAMKDLFRREMEERKFTVVVASHKLQDIEDICHKIAILHQGGILTAGEMKAGAKDIHKIQCVFADQEAESYIKEHFDVVRYRRDGYFFTLILKGEISEVIPALNGMKPEFIKEVPMTLEEIFLSEMEGAGYDIRKVFE